MINYYIPYAIRQGIYPEIFMLNIVFDAYAILYLQT